MPKNKTHCPRPGLEPGPLHPETSALTVRPPRLPYKSNLNLGLFTPYQKKQPFLLFHHPTTSDSSDDHYQGSRGYQNVCGRLETSFVHESLVVIGTYSCKDPHGHDCNTCGLETRIIKDFYRQNLALLNLLEYTLYKMIGFFRRKFSLLYLGI